MTTTTETQPTSPNDGLFLVVDRLMAMQEREQRSRWRKFWLFWVALLVGPSLLLLIGYALDHIDVLGKEYAALVRLQGEIGSHERVSAQNILPALDRAFDDKNAKGVVLLINSPGGSPVQSSLIHDRIMKYRVEHPERSVVAVAEDAVTSGAYWIAAAAPELYVNRSTLTGSIGVIMNGFGIDLAQINKRYGAGITRRSFHVGPNKDRLDPFKPVTTDDERKVGAVLAAMHGHFIDAVLSTRKDKLKGDPSKLFSGDFWTGAEAVQLGLADGLSDLSSVLKSKYGVTDVRDYTPPYSIFEKLQRSYGVLEEVMDFIATSTASPVQ